MTAIADLKIFVSALVAKVLTQDANTLVSALVLVNKAEVLTIAQGFGSSKLIRQLRLVDNAIDNTLLKLDPQQGNQVFYQGQLIGQKQILYKSPLPGELQARLAIESITDRFLEYLQKVHQIVVLNESDRHVQVFIPYKPIEDFKTLWKNFLIKVAFSTYGNTQHQLPGLIHTFVALINNIKLAKKETGGFGILHIPILTRDHATTIAAFYYAVLKSGIDNNKLSDSQIQKLETYKISNLNAIKNISLFSDKFTALAKSQITLTNPRITKIISELSTLIELIENERFDSLPKSVFTEYPPPIEVRTPGDDNGNFCYSCGISLKEKEKKWETLRIVFQSPSQRLQSSSGERQPRICSACIALSFASPLKLSHRNIILKLSSKTRDINPTVKVREYLRMLATKELNFSAGKYLMLPSEVLQKGKDKVYVSQKLGEVQYALVKVASIFPLEVFTDFNFSLITQGSESIRLESRYLIFIKGLIDCYTQSTIIYSKEEKKGNKNTDGKHPKENSINMPLGNAVRYVEKDLPYFAEYTLTKIANASKQRELEQVREAYWKTIQKDLESKGDSMSSDSQLSKRAKLYRDVAALTGLTYAFAQSLESTAKKAMKQEDAEREISKLIEKVNDAVAFCYYATLGDEKKTSVEARLWKNLDNYFVYEQTQTLLNQLEISGREKR